jgi:hypothetical protein
MNRQKKKPGTFHLQKSNNRWKWMAGATAATAAGVTASQASTITINLAGNYISVTDGNHLNADLTGDGHPDLTIANAFNFAGLTSQSFYRLTARVNLNGVRATGLAKFRSTLSPLYLYERLGLRVNSTSFVTTFSPASLTGSIPIFFKDLHINGGAPTKGSLEVTVGLEPGSFARPEIRLDSFTYNDPPPGRGPTVPDQGSSLALLAMGAGGVLALRRLRAGQGGP